MFAVILVAVAIVVALIVDLVTLAVALVAVTATVAVPISVLVLIAIAITVAVAVTFFITTFAFSVALVDCCISVEPALVLRCLTLRFASAKVCLGAAFRGSRHHGQGVNERSSKCREVVRCCGLGSAFSAMKPPRPQVL
jgi:hypothetical protein